MRLIRRPRNGESLRETIDEMIEEPRADDPDPLGAHERVLIGNILKGHDQTAADVMVPRVDIVALDVETPFPDVVKCMIEQGHSRVPVYRETLDDVIGFIHVKDILAAGCRAARNQAGAVAAQAAVRGAVAADPRARWCRCARRAPTSRWSSTSSAGSTGW